MTMMGYMFYMEIDYDDYDFWISRKGFELWIIYTVFFDNDKTPCQKIKEKIQFNFKTPPKFIHNEKLKIWAEFPLKFKETP